MALAFSNAGAQVGAGRISFIFVDMVSILGANHSNLFSSMNGRGLD